MKIKVKFLYTPMQLRKIRVHVFPSDKLEHQPLGQLYYLKPTDDGDEIYQREKDMEVEYAVL